MLPHSPAGTIRHAVAAVVGASVGSLYNAKTRRGVRLLPCPAERTRLAGTSANRTGEDVLSLAHQGWADVPVPSMTL
jgi:hypothetical protein